MELLIAMLVLLPLPAIVQVAIRFRRRRRRLARWSDPPAGVTDQSFRGYKVAQFVMGPTDAYLMGVLDVRYGVDDRAVCLRPRCSPPGLDCLCGFYAYKHRTAAVGLLHELSRISPQDMYVLLSTDVDGDVLEYEHGYRAERQRVVRIELPDRCWECWGQPRGNSTVAYLSHPRFRTEHLGGTQDVQAHSALPRGAAPLRALCRDHAPSRGAQTFTASDLRARIGTEVAILPEAEQPRRDQAPTEAA